jgi:hypothetical protein
MKFTEGVRKRERGFAEHLQVDTAAVTARRADAVPSGDGPVDGAVPGHDGDGSGGGGLVPDAVLEAAEEERGGDDGGGARRRGS